MSSNAIHIKRKNLTTMGLEDQTLREAFQVQPHEIPVTERLRVLEARPAPEAGGGELRWKKLAESLGDCRHVLISGMGETPRAMLTSYGVEPLEVGGFIEEALRAIYAGDDLSALRIRKGKSCCAEKMGMGGGMGCM